MADSNTSVLALITDRIVAISADQLTPPPGGPMPAGFTVVGYMTEHQQRLYTVMCMSVNAHHDQRRTVRELKAQIARGSSPGANMLETLKNIFKGGLSLDKIQEAEAAELKLLELEADKNLLLTLFSSEIYSHFKLYGKYPIRVAPDWSVGWTEQKPGIELEGFDISFGKGFPPELADLIRRARAA